MIDKKKLRSFFEAGMDKVSVRNDNEPMSTGQRAALAKLLSPYEG